MPVLPATLPFVLLDVASPMVTSLDRFDVAQSTADYGSDILTQPDLDDSLIPRSGNLVLADALSRRLECARGALWPFPDYGRDIRRYLNARVTTASLAAMRQDIIDQFQQDERVQGVSASLSFDRNLMLVTASINVVAADGPFVFTLGISQLSVAILTGP